MVKVLVDYREAASPVVRELEALVKVEFATLDVGDYVVSDRCCVERKTCEDFAKSVIDGRLFEQAAKLKELYQLPIVLIEGRELYARLPREATLGALASLFCDHGVAVFRTSSAAESASLIAALAKREQVKEKRAPRLRAKPKFKDLASLQEFLVASLPGIDRRRAKELLRHFGTPLKLFNASFRELTRVPGIGEKTARKIRDVLASRYREQKEKQARLGEISF